MSDAIDKRKVFVIHGRNEKINKAMFDFLRALDLNPLEWSELVAQTGKGSPHISEIIRGIRNAGAVVALLTPDDLAFLNPVLWKETDKDHEKQPTPQGRPNVLFEMGMAFALQEAQTIIVQVGELRPFSDIAGRHVVRFDGSPDARNELKTRLRTAGCPVKETGLDWLRVGDFPLQTTREFKLNIENSTIGGTRNSSTFTEGGDDLEAKRQLVYARAIEILTKVDVESSKIENDIDYEELPWHPGSPQHPDWRAVSRQLMTRDFSTGFPRAIIEPSVFRSIDRGKMKVAARTIEMYLSASDQNSGFHLIRKKYDLPDPNQVRKEFHDAELTSILV